MTTKDEVVALAVAFPEANDRGEREEARMEAATTDAERKAAAKACEKADKDYNRLRGQLLKAVRGLETITIH